MIADSKPVPPGTPPPSPPPGDPTGPKPTGPKPGRAAHIDSRPQGTPGGEGPASGPVVHGGATGTRPDAGIQPGDSLMTVAEVARAFRVDPKTVTRWAKAGRLEALKTPTGRNRFRASVVMGHLGRPS